MRWRDLNEETTEEIWRRLPVKSLVRLRCVCKSWGFRFGSPDFIEAHHRTQRAIHNAADGNAKFLARRLRFEGVNFFTTMDVSIDEEENVSVKEKENIYFPYLCSGAVVFGPCNGIVCVDTIEDGVLWNPATRQVKVLQLPTIVVPAADSIDYTDSYDCIYSYILGFGYDPTTNDYKVLRTVEDGGDITNSVIRIELYSLNKNEWRLLPDQYNDFPRWNGICPQLCVDGVCHIIGYCRVLSFNFVDEIFTSTVLPECLQSGLSHEVAMVSVNGCVGMVRCIIGEGFLQVWVLKEIGVPDSWTKQATIRVVDGITRFLGFLNGMVFVEINREQLVAYNPKTLQLQTLLLNPVDELEFDNWVQSLRLEERVGVREFSTYQWNFVMQFIDYVESLVPLNGIQEQEKGITRSFLQ